MTPNHIPHLPRRAVLTSLLIAPAGGVLARLPGDWLASPALAADSLLAAASADVRDLGVAMTSINVRSLDFGTSVDGTPVAYALSSGDPLSFNVIDLNTGERLFAERFPPYLFHGSVHTAMDGSVYFCSRSPSTLWRYYPLQNRVEKIADSIIGETWILDMRTDHSGLLYMATYPGANVASYDPQTGTVRQYGSVAGDAAYAQTLELVDGEVWVGTGPRPHLLQLRPDTGVISEIPIPSHYLEGTSYVLDLEKRRDLLFVRFSPRGRFDMTVYDLRNDRWLDLLPSTMPAAPTSASDDMKAYYLTYKDLIGYDLPTRRTFATGFAATELPQILAETPGTYGIHLTHLAGDAHPGENVVGMASDGRLWRYNLAKKRGDVLRPDILGANVRIRGVGHGPDGHVYLGAYDSAGVMARIDKTNDEVTQLSGPKQADSIAPHGSLIAIGSYDRATVHIGDPSAEWNWGTNPRELLKLGRGAPYHQDRIHSMVSTGDLLAVATIPEPGQLGGSLTLVNTTTGAVQFNRHVVTDQSIVSIAYRDGLIYGGTSINGGLSTAPTASEAALFVWDVAAGTKLWEGTPVPGSPTIGGLAWGPEGNLWGMSEDGAALEFDPRSRTVVRTVQAVPKAGIDKHIWGGHVSLVYDATTDGFYGTAGKRLFHLSHTTSEVTILKQGIVQAVRSGAGGIYCVDTTNAYRIDG